MNKILSISQYTVYAAVYRKRALCENPFPMNTQDRNLRDIFQENLNRIYEEKDLTEEEMSDLTGLDSTFCGRLRRGERVPSLDTIQKICNGLEVEVSELLEE